MCGRFTLRTPQNRLAAQFGIQATRPRYNIAPTQQVLVLRGDAREVLDMRWGLPSAYAGRLLINARSETAASKPTFREAFRQRRCLVPADGFYEWKREGTRKQPFYIQIAEGEPFAFAGLWEGAPGHETFTILTTAANELLSGLHERMPVIIEPDDYTRWLDPRTPLDEVQGLLRSYPSERMTLTPVSDRVNSAAQDDASCLSPPRRDNLLF